MTTLKEPEILVCLLPNWPPLPMGVAVTKRGILLRKGLSRTQRARALAWGRERWAKYQTELRAGLYPDHLKEPTWPNLARKVAV